MARSDKALRSFFGAREGGQDRPQSINTPRFLIDAILSVWPEGIELDPCSNADSIVPARDRICEPKEFGERSGLSEEWPDFAYANPPYGDFETWLRKVSAPNEHLMLGPVRTNRAWFCVKASEASRICYLKPFKFLGDWPSAFPASLAMFYYGQRIEAFDAAFYELGVLGKFIIYMKPNAQLSMFDKPEPEGFYDPSTGEIYD
jgi:hypothetical protein